MSDSKLNDVDFTVSDILEIGARYAILPKSSVGTFFPDTKILKLETLEEAQTVARIQMLAIYRNVLENGEIATKQTCLEFLFYFEVLTAREKREISASVEIHELYKFPNELEILHCFKEYLK